MLLKQNNNKDDQRVNNEGIRNIEESVESVHQVIINQVYYTVLNLKRLLNKFK